MNNIEIVYKESQNIKKFASGYIEYLKKLLSNLDLDSIAELESEFQDTYDAQRRLFVAGNGGSATTASTMENDIGFDLIRKTNIKKPLKISSLTDNTSVITAISNDTGYDNVFINQLRLHYTEGDKLLVISASGNSENLIRAANWVKERNGRVLGLLGFDGGKLLEICDVKAHVKSLPGEFGPVEDIHLVMNHILAHWFQNKFK